MANDVGIRLGIGGEKEFKSALSGIESQIKNLNSEMKTVVTSMAGMDDAEENATKKMWVLRRSISATGEKIDILSKQYSDQKKRLEELGRAMDNAITSGDQVAITRATNAYNRQAKEVSDLGTKINNATSSMNRMQKEMRDIEKGADKATDAVDDLGNEAKETGSRLKEAFAGGAVAGAVNSLISGISNLISSTTEYRKIMSALEISSGRAGYTAKETAESYDQLYGVLGDDQRSATALANLQAVGLEQEDLTKLIDGAIGAWAIYGDSIPIDSLSEAINETIQVGKVTGTFADVLNWAGTSEDDFNARLAATSSATERANLVLQELEKQGLMGAAAAWRENNIELYEAQIAQKNLNEALAEIARILTPIVTMAKRGITTILNGMIQIVNAFKEGGIDAVFNKIAGGFSTLIDEMDKNLPKFIENGNNILNSIISGIGQGIPVLAENAAKIITTIISALQSSFPIVLQQGKEALESLIEGILQGIPVLVSQLPQIIAAFTNYIASSFPQILKNGTEILLKLGEGIIDAIPKLIEQIPQIIEAILTMIAKNLPQMIETGTEILLKLGEGIVKAIPKIIGLIPEILQSIINTFRSIKNGMKEIGKSVIEGLWAGIESAKDWIKGKVEGAINSIKNIFTGKKGFFTGSPSKWAKNVGLFIMEGLGIGILKDKTAKTAAENQVNGIKEIVLNAADELNEALLAKEEELAERLSNTGLDEVTKESLKNQLEAVKEFRTEYENALLDIEKSQEAMTNKLKSYGTLFETVKNETGSFIELRDIEKDIETIEKYGNALENLKNRGIPDSLLNEITDMSVDDALLYTEKLLSMTDEQYQEYMALWNEKQEAARQVASAFYIDEMDALKKEFVDKIPDELSGVKDEMRDIGINGIQGMIDGMRSKSGALWSAASSIVSEAIRAMRRAADINSPSGETKKLVGAPMGEGVIVGFVEGMKKARSSIETALMMPFDRIKKEDIYSSAAGMVNGMAAATAAPSGGGLQTIIIPVNLNGSQIAEIVYEPLKKVKRQKGD